MNKSRVKELSIGFGFGILTNLIYAILLQKFNIYVIAILFFGALGIYSIVWYLILKPSRILGKAKIKSIYDTFSKSRSFVKQTLLQSSTIKIMTIGGGSIIEDERGEFLDILEKRAREGAEVKILLLNPDSHWLEDRINELNRIRPGKLTMDTWRPSIIANIQKIKSRNKTLPTQKIELRFYDTKPIWRLYLLDNLAFVGSYLEDKPGHETQQLLLTRGSDLFNALERLFDNHWEIGLIPDSWQG